MRLEHQIEIEWQDEQALEGSDLRVTGWKVTYGDRFADFLTYEEMLGLVASLTMADNPGRRCLAWLRTREQIAAEELRWKVRRREEDTEILAANPITAGLGRLNAFVAKHRITEAEIVCLNSSRGGAGAQLHMAALARIWPWRVFETVPSSEDYAGRVHVCPFIEDGVSIACVVEPDEQERYAAMLVPAAPRPSAPAESEVLL